MSEYYSGEIVEGKKLRKVAKIKSNKIKNNDYEDWQKFQESIWLTFKALGFNQMNGQGRFILNLDRIKDKKEIDILAKDEESVFVIESKISRADLKTQLAAWARIRSDIKEVLKKIFAENQLRINFVFALNEEFSLTEAEINIIKENHFFVWNVRDLEYLGNLSKLYKRIGDVTRYQLYAIILRNKEIVSLKNSEPLPAIKGKIGKKNYYSFLINPEHLLKISYVHHRSGIFEEAGEEIKAYQRMLVDSKLKKIEEFINKDRYFPNSVIVNFKQSLQECFEPKAPEKYEIKYGLLKVPNKFGVAWIIDGQHRLYGYSKSKRKSTATLPVVAFENLNVSEQAKLFVEINKNQTPVKPDLLWVLYPDIYEDTEDEEQELDLRISHIAQKLNQDNNSPLKDCVYIIGINKRSKKTNITMRTLCEAIKTNKLLDYLQDTFKNRKEIIKKQTELIKAFLNVVHDLFPDNWNEGEQGFLRTNNGISAFFKILKELLQHFKNKENEKLYFKSDLSDFGTEVKKLLIPAMDYLKSNPEIPISLRKNRGEAGQVESAEDLCIRIHETYANFDTVFVKNALRKKEIDKEIKDFKKDFKKESFNIKDYVLDSELEIRDKIKQLLKNHYKEVWYRQGLTGRVKENIDKEIEQKIKESPYRMKDYEDLDHKFDEVTIPNLKEIVAWSNNSTIFEPFFGKEFHIAKNFSDFYSLRCEVTHPNTCGIDEIILHKGIYGIKWIKKCLNITEEEK